MNWKVFLNIIIVVIGILTIVWSNFINVFIIYQIGIIVGMIIVLVGVSLIVKPNWRKIVITLILAFILISITYFYTSEGSVLEADFDSRGLPFPYYQCVTSHLPHMQPNTYCDFNVGPDEFPYIWLVIDVLFWHIISTLIIWVYDKFRKKKKEDYVHIKDVNMVMGQLEKWGKKEKKK